MLRKMLRLIHVIIFAIIRLNEAERMTERRKILLPVSILQIV